MNEIPAGRKRAYKELFQEYSEDFSESGVCPAYHDLGAISERYVDQGLLGRGAVKEVRKCYDEKSKRTVAMARLKEGLGPEHYDSFIHEAWLTSSLEHPNIITVYEVDIDDQGAPYFTMELRSNRDLGEYVRGDIGLYDRINTFLVICRAMEYAHNRDVIHLDLKPENIQCDDYGEILICDWGLGKLLNVEQEHLDASESQTLVGEVKGSLGYLSPEQVHQNEDKGYWSDIYSLGCLLHYLLIGQPPYRGSKDTVLRETIKGDLEPIKKQLVEGGVPMSVIAVILKCVAQSPSDRYGSVSAIRKDLSLYLEGHVTSAESASVLLKMAKFVQRHLKKFALGIVILGMMGAVGWYLGAQRDSYLTQQSELDREIQELLEEKQVILDFTNQEVDGLFEKLLAQCTKLYYSMDTCSDEEFLTLYHRGRRLMDEAYTLAPNHVGLYNIRVLYYFSTMNFEQVLEMDRPKSTREHPLVDNLLNRAQQMQDIIREVGMTEMTHEGVASLIAPLVPHITEREYRCFIFMARYQYLSGARGDYNEVINQLLRMRNNKLQTLSFRYSSTDRRMTLESEDEIYLLNNLIMSRLSLEELQILSPEGCFIKPLHGAEIRSLDLSMTMRAYLDDPIELSGLQELSLPIIPMSARAVRERVRSTSGSLSVSQK